MCLCVLRYTGFVLGGAETLLDTAIQDMGGRAEKEDACAGEHVSANLADEVKAKQKGLKSAMRMEQRMLERHDMDGIK